MHRDEVLPAAARPSGLADPAVRGPIRRYQVTTSGTGLVTAGATAAVLGLQADPAYARAVLEARSWGQGVVSDADVAGFLTPPGGAALGAAAVLAVTAVLVLGAQRLWRPTRWLGTVTAVLAVLTAAFWAVDGGRMLALGARGVVALVAVGAMFVFCAVWLLFAHLRSTRDAFDG